MGGEPRLLVAGPDNKSVRAFRNRVRGVEQPTDFYRLTGKSPDTLLMDAATGSEWNFQGCAIGGKSKGACLERVTILKDYWFDWRNYHPATTVYRLPPE